MSLLIRILAALQSCRLLGIFGVSASRLFEFRSGRAPDVAGEGGCVWFHASSQGELEMLRPLIDDLLDRRGVVGVSVFSESALPGLSGLEGRAVYAGLSPREDLWESWFASFGVRKLVLSKYDLWPGLLRAARKTAVPVLVINAEWRRSVSMIIRLFQLFGEPLPEMRFFVNETGQRSLLRFSQVLPGAQVEISGNPRWERVRRRIGRKEGNPLVQEWSHRIQRLPRPVLMVGSAWPEDLEFLIPGFKKTKGSLVVVPHRLDPETLQEMGALLEGELPGRFLLVPVMGILVELYGLADRAFVGGGFGKGVHSTLEPAVSGVPTACGPAKVESFPETCELRRRGALVVCSNGPEFSEWLARSAPGRLRPEDLQNLVSGYHRLLEQCL